MSLPTHHFKLTSHRGTSFTCSDEILNFFSRMALPKCLQFLCAEYFIKLHAEAVKRGLVGHYDEANEQKLITLMSELTFISNTPPPSPVKPKASLKTKAASNV